MRSITTSPSRGRRLLAALLTLALGVSLLGVGLAPSALAAAQAEITGLGQASRISAKIGAGSTFDITAGLIEAEIDGVDTVTYCVDLHTSLGSLPVTFDEVGLDTVLSDPAARLNILKILVNYGPPGTAYPGGSFGPAGHEITGSGNEQAASVQAAIWHFSDDLQLQSGGETSATEKSNYDAILAALATLPDPTAPAVSLDIIPPADTSTLAGGLVGPYTVSTTAASVALTTASGVTITDNAGNPLAGPFGDGSQVWLKKATTGSPNPALTATATAPVHAGRAFVYGRNPGARQRLILAVSATGSVKDTAPATWTKPAKAKVQKDINGGPVPQGGFTFTITGPGLPPAGVSGSVATDGGYAFLSQNLTAGTYTITETPIAGWEQLALSCAAPATNVIVNGASATFTISDSASDQWVRCQFQNNKHYGLKIKKVVSNAPATWAGVGYDGAAETFTIGWSCTRASSPTLTGSVQLLQGAETTVPGIPYGYSCSISGESALPSLEAGVGWNAPGLPQAVVVNGSQGKLIVTNSFSDTRVGFTVSKVLQNAAGSGVATDAAFPITVTCTKGGSPDRVFNDTISVGDPWTSPLLAPGYSCQITEGSAPGLPDGYAWATPAISPNPVVVGQHNSATVTNTVTDQRVRFTVTKDLVAPEGSGVDGSTSFDVTVTCTKGETSIVFGDDSPEGDVISLTDDDSWTSPLIPAGYSCEVEEGTLPQLVDGFEWAAPVITPNPLVTGQQSSATITNTVNDPRVVLRVSKEFANLEGSGVDDDQPFDLLVTCVKGDVELEFDFTLADGETWTSPKLPAGYECTVDETLPVELLSDGFSFDTPGFDPSGTVTTARTDLEIEVDNAVHDDRVSIALAKNVQGDTADADVPADAEYLVDITCVGDDPGETVTFDDVAVSVGAPTTGIGPVPIGWVCTPVEDESSLPALAAGHVWLDPVVEDATVNEDGGTVTVTNEVEDRRSSITIRKDVVEGSAPFGTFTFDLVRVDGEVEEVIAQDVDVQVGDDPVVLADELLAGTYRVVEHPKSGWDLVGVECSVEGGGDEVVIGSDTEAATIACAATNVELGSITVVKETDPTDADVDFPVTLTGDGYEESATVNATADPVVFDGLLPGTYDLTEGEVDGWDNGPIECTVVEEAQESLVSRASAVLADGLEVAPGDDVVCTITNVERGTIGITKQVQGDTVNSGALFTPWTSNVVVRLACDDEQTETLTLVPGATAGTLVSSDVLEVSAGTTCTVTEVADGTASGSGVAITIGGVPIIEGTPSSPVTVDAGEELVVAVVNTYTGTQVLPNVIERPTTQVAPTALPRTGSDSDRMLLLAGVLTLLGGLLLLGGSVMDQRRRRVVLRRR